MRRREGSAPRWHAIAVVLAVFLAALVRYWPEITFFGTLSDEVYYERAFRAAASGQSPYVPGFFYPYPLALLGGACFRAFGWRATFTAMRLLEALGAAFVVEASLRWLRLRLPARLVLALAIFAVAPSIKHALDFGNLGALAAGLGLLGIVALDRRPWTGAIAIGLSLAMKPMLIAAVVLLFVHGVRRDRRIAAAAALSTIVALAPLAVRPSLIGGMVGIGDAPISSSMFSLYRALYLFGVYLPPMAITAAVVGLAAIVAFVLPLEFRAAALIGCVASVLSLPYVWKHTLLLVVPVQTLAIAATFDAWRAARGDAPKDRRDRALLAFVGSVFVNALLFTADALPFVQALHAPAALTGALVVLLDALPVLLLPWAIRGARLATPS